MSKKIYIVEISDAINLVGKFTIAAASSAAAKAFVSRQFIEARMAEPLELVGIGLGNVIDADTGLPMNQLAAAQPEQRLGLPLPEAESPVTEVQRSVWPDRMDAVDLR